MRHFHQEFVHKNQKLQSITGSINQVSNFINVHLNILMFMMGWQTQLESFPSKSTKFLLKCRKYREPAGTPFYGDFTQMLQHRHFQFHHKAMSDQLLEHTTVWLTLVLSEEAMGLDAFKIWGGFSQLKAKNHSWVLLTLNQQAIFSFKLRFVKS